MRHRRISRHSALRRRLTNGSSKTRGELIAAASEEAIYEALGLQLVPPPMREDKGEVERAAEGTLPPVARLEDLRGDLHVHTSLSGDGRSTLEEVVAAARAARAEAECDHRRGGEPAGDR